MANLLEICNSALVKIGSRTILSIDQDNKEANLCKVRFTHCKKAVLRMHPWNCATKRMTLASTTDTPAFSYTYQFPLPTDCLRIIECSEDVYAVEGRLILANSATLDLIYIQDVDESLLDSMCVEALAAYLAWDISYALTQSDNVKNSLWESFRKLLPSAKSVDSQEEMIHVVEANTYIDARFTGDDRLLPKRNWPA